MSGPKNSPRAGAQPRWRHVDYRTELDEEGIKKWLRSDAARDLEITSKSELVRRIWSVMKRRIEEKLPAELSEPVQERGTYRQADIEPEIADDIDAYVNSPAGRMSGLTEKPDLFVPSFRRILSDSGIVPYVLLSSVTDVGLDDLKKAKSDGQAGSRDGKKRRRARSR